MRLKIKILEFLAGRPVSILNVNTANKINVHVDERISISKKGKSIISIVDTAMGFIKPNEILVSNEIISELGLKKGEIVEVSLAQAPESATLIRKKLECKPLNSEEIKKVIADIVKNALTETEIAYFVSAVYKCGMSNKEISALVRAMVGVGERLKFSGKIVDKHSIGGVAGNRTTPIVVSICASVGLVMPKTSSRAITTATGTADVIESIANVEFSIKEIKKIIKKTGACLVWGGSLGLSPADDKIIQVERVLHLDPEPQLLASVLSKKISVGSKYVLIDIPYGKYAKVSKKHAVILKRKFENLAKHFGLKLKCILTHGNKPIGRGIGPLLEVRDVISVLKREKDCPKDLEKKSISLAGQIFELCGKSKKGKGRLLAEEILNSGKAFSKFKQIICAQGGKIPKRLKFGKFQHTFYAAKSGKIKEVNNRLISALAMLAGSPMDKTAGLFLHKNAGEYIKKGDKILTIYSESKTRLKTAKDFFKKSNLIVG